MQNQLVQLLLDKEQYTWYRITRSAEDARLPQQGKVTTLTLKGKKLCLANVEGEYYAVQDACPHAYGSLGKGWCEGADVVCPVHRMKFNVKTGANTTGEGYRLTQYPTEMTEEGLYIGLSNKKWFQFWK